jgi:hypothetical protein
MNMRKTVTGALVALTAGATMAFGAMAALSDFVVTSDNSLTSPIIVVGTPDTAANAGYAKDVIGAADIAAAVAGYATTDVTVGGGTTVSVSNGVDLASTNTKIYLGDNLGKAGLKSTVTKQVLPTLLASGTVTDKTGTEYTYDQYINVAGSTAYNAVTFGTSGGDDLTGNGKADPALYINLSTSTDQPLYNLTVVFNKVLNITNTNVQGKTITLFGKSYTIGAQSSTYASPMVLELFGGSNSQTLKVGDTAEVNVGGVTHTVSVIGVSDTTTAVISVDGQTEEVFEGTSVKILGVDVYIDSIFYFAPDSGSPSTVKLSLGSAKLTLEDDASVVIGDDTVDGTKVHLYGTAATGLSKIEISVAATDSSKDWIVPGTPFTDPVFGGFKVAFGGLTRGTLDTITVDNAGTTGATLRFTDSRNYEKSINWIYAASSGTFAPALNASSTQKYVVVEGQAVARNDYFLITPSQESEFSHIMQYKTVSGLGGSNAYIELADVMSGATQKIYLTDNSGYGATFYLDGQSYYVNVSAADQTAKFTWGTSAGYENAGAKTTVFPLIQAKNGEWVTLVKSLALGSTTGVTYELPGNTSALITNNTDTITAGRLTYTFDDGVSTTTLTDIGDANVSASPAVLIYEEDGKDASNTDVKDAIFVTVSDGDSTSSNKVTVDTPILTAATQFSSSQETDSSVTEYYDRYGTYLKYDSDSDGMITVEYPDDQSVAMVAVGADPSFGTAAGGSTVKSAIMIKNPVAKLDTEVQSLVSAGTLNADVILVGGPCANKLTATVMGIPNTQPACYEQFNYNKLIKVYNDQLVAGKMALVVAGFTADDTRAAAAQVMTGVTSLEETRTA